MPAKLIPSVTPLDGTTFQKEFPAWVTTPPKNILTNNMKSEFKNVPSPKENVYYETLKPIFCVLTLAGVLPVFKVNIGKFIFSFSFNFMAKLLLLYITIKIAV